MGTRTSIVVGAPSALYVADAGTDSPIDESTQTIDWTDYEDVGFTVEGLTLTYTPEWFETRVDQSTVALDRYLISENLEITFNLAEALLSQLQYAIAAATYTAGTPGTDPHKLEIGGGSITERTFGFQATAANLDAEGNHKTLIIWIPRVHATAEVGIPFVKDGERRIPVTFTALGDTSQSAGAQLVQLFETTSEGGT